MKKTQQQHESGIALSLAMIAQGAMGPCDILGFDGDRSDDDYPGDLPAQMGVETWFRYVMATKKMFPPVDGYAGVYELRNLHRLAEGFDSGAEYLYSQGIRDQAGCLFDLIEAGGS